MCLPTAYPKDGVKFFTAVFMRLEGAIAARNCLHKFQVQGKADPKLSSTLEFSFEPIAHSSWLFDLFNKPRIFGPLLALLVLTLTLFIFDLLRVWFMQSKITSGDPNLHINKAKYLWKDLLVSCTIAKIKDGLSSRSRSGKTMSDMCVVVAKPDSTGTSEWKNHWKTFRFSSARHR